MRKLDFDTSTMFYEWDDLANDHELIREVMICIQSHHADLGASIESRFRPDPDASYRVSAEYLKTILQTGEDVHGVATNREITNCLVFNASHIRDFVASQKVLQARDRVDQIVFSRIRELFGMKRGLSLSNSGHFLYPPGGYMSWHTNSQKPGWRLYINYAEEPGKSFFRYLDPESGEIVTSYDRQWNFRFFRIDPAKPFWHTVYSDTYRYSLGFRAIRNPQPPFFERVLRRTGRIFSELVEVHDK